jgi:phosphoribosyl 1,2-cyclic phosphodiesterase
MQLVVLGSGAAEAIPNPYCRCRVCQVAREEGGPERRARAAVLVDGCLLIDLGPDVISSAVRLNLYLGAVGTVLITHRHSDHWLPDNLHWREPGFAATPVAPLSVYGPEDAVADVAPYLDRTVALDVRAVTGGDQWRAGRYTITAVPATHGSGTLEPLLYVVDDGERRLFYATDTSSLGEEAWEVLRSLGSMDAVLLDETSGLRSGGSGHHGLAKYAETQARLRAEGVTREGTQMIAHHFSHNGGLTHAELVERLQPAGVTVSYDGLVVTL